MHRKQPSVWRRLAISVPIGLCLAAVTWLVGLAGVHVYSADRLQWILLFPAAFAGELALGIHAAQWMTYAFLLVSATSVPGGRRYFLAFGIALAVHVGVALVTFEFVGT